MKRNGWLNVYVYYVMFLDIVNEIITGLKIAVKKEKKIVITFVRQCNCNNNCNNNKSIVNVLVKY